MLLRVPQYWLKPLGVTEPRNPMPNAWTVGANLKSYDLITGPATQRQPPQMGRGDKVIFHAVIHVRLFAAAELLDNPDWRSHPKWGFRWPWVYPARVDTWIPLIEDGPYSTDVVPKRVMGRIQSGADFAKLSVEEYEALLHELRECATVQQA
jgi:hypothetical protein